MMWKVMMWKIVVLSMGLGVGASMANVVAAWDVLTGREYNLYSSTNLYDGFTLLQGGMLYPQNSYTDSAGTTKQSVFYKLEVVQP